MKILVLGGSYFLGKTFVNLFCREHEITVLNRGNRKNAYTYPKLVKHIVCDRHALKESTFGDRTYDAVVDFCAYEPGDIESTAKCLQGRIKQYIFVSTCDVYKRGTGAETDESGELEYTVFGGEEGQYIAGKVALEQELLSCAGEYGFGYASVRPAIIYGPENYAPRDKMFFNWIDSAGQILYPVNATGSFQMVYVEDVARCIGLLIGNEAACNKNFNICGEGRVTYESYAAALAEATGVDFTKVEITVEEIGQRGIPLPYPLTEAETEYYTTSSEVLQDYSFKPLAEGMKAAYASHIEGELFQKIDEYFDQNQPKEAEKYMISCLGKALHTGSKSLELRLYNELIGYYRQTSEYEPLNEVIEASKGLIAGETFAGTVNAATTSLNIANAYRSMGRLEESEEYYEITEDIYRTAIENGALGEQDMLLAGLYNNESLLYQEMDKYERALDSLQKALAIVTANNAGFEIAVTHANLANTYLLAGKWKEAKEYSDRAIALFKARGLKDAHYAAAVYALGCCYMQEENMTLAKAVLREAAEAIASTVGQNKQYERVCLAIEQCEQETGPGVSGLELSEKYYETFGAPMIKEQFGEYESLIAVGLVGQGSECFGYDDALSTDHDFGPSFCMWLNDETYDKIGDKLKAAYEALPASFMGYERTSTAMGAGRRGVFRISDFYKNFVGTEDVKAIDYAAVEDYSLAAAVNGKVFRDDEGVFTAIRNQLLTGYPESIRLLKLATDCGNFSQTGQYNFPRMIKRHDLFTAGTMVNDCLRHAMKLYHHFCNVYPPHDKWLYKSTASLPGGLEITTALDKIFYRQKLGQAPKAVFAAIEELGQIFADKMYATCDISDIDNYLDHQTEELLLKADFARASDTELVKQIAKLEFKAFDKVKNEGGRASCQNDWPTFSIMRKSQYMLWDRKMLLQYLYDFTRELSMGHNLITEKYGRMMESTTPERYAELQEYFSEMTEEKKAIIEQIVAVQMTMMEEFAAEHPKMAGNARTLHSYDDQLFDTSYETYLRGEISTYSDKMLQLYGAFVVGMVNEGKNIARCTMENTAKLYGYAGIEEFEASIR